MPQTFIYQHNTCLPSGNSQSIALSLVKDQKMLMNLNRHLNKLLSSLGIPRWLYGKESSCQCRRRNFNPWVRKNPWSRKWQPTPVFLPGKSHRGAWWATVHGAVKSWRQLSNWATMLCMLCTVKKTHSLVFCPWCCSLFFSFDHLNSLWNGQESAH